MITSVGARTRVRIAEQSSYSARATSGFQDLVITSEEIKNERTNLYSQEQKREIHKSKRGVRNVFGPLRAESSFTNQEILSRNVFGSQVVLQGADVSKTTFLTSNYTQGSGVLPVRDTSGFSASGNICVTRRNSDKDYYGYEKFPYSSVTATTFNVTGDDFDHVKGDIVFSYNTANDPAYTYLFTPSKFLNRFLTIEILRDLALFRATGAVLNSIKELFSPSSFCVCEIETLCKDIWLGTTLAEDVTPGETAIDVVDATGMPSLGEIVIGSETGITYGNIVGNTLLGVSGVTEEHFIGEPVGTRTFTQFVDDRTISPFSGTLTSVWFKNRPFEPLDFAYSLSNNCNDSIFFLGENSRGSCVASTRTVSGSLTVPLDLLELWSDSVREVLNDGYHKDFKLLTLDTEPISGTSLFPAKMLFFPRVEINSYLLSDPSKGMIVVDVALTMLYDDIMDVPEVILAVTNNTSATVDLYEGPLTMNTVVTFTEAGDSTVAAGQGWIQRNGQLRLEYNTLDDAWPDLTGWTTDDDQDDPTNKRGWIGPKNERLIIFVNALTGDWNQAPNTTAPGVKHNTGLTGNFTIIMNLGESYYQGDTYEQVVMAVTDPAQAVPSIDDWIRVAYRWDGKTSAIVSKAGVTTYTAGNARTKPVWMRIARSGTTITVSDSQNGSAWTTIQTYTSSAHNLGSAAVDLYLAGSSGAVNRDVIFEIESITGDITDDFDDNTFTDNWTQVNTAYGDVFEGAPIAGGTGLIARTNNVSSNDYTTTFNAPRAYRPVTGDFRVWWKQTIYNRSTNYEWAGIVFGTGSVGRLGIGQGFSSSAKLIIRDNTGAYAETTLSDTSNPVWFLVERIGDNYLVYYTTSEPTDPGDPAEYTLWKVWYTLQIAEPGDFVDINVCAHNGGTTPSEVFGVFEYLSGGKLPTTAQTATIRNMAPSSAVVSVDSVTVYFTGLTGTFTCDVQRSARGADIWTTILAAQSLTTSPTTITLGGDDWTGDYDCRVIMSGQSPDGDDVGKSIDDIVYTYTI